MLPAIEQIIDDFNLLDDWQDRYRYVIDLGKELEVMPEELHTLENKVPGCISQVWMVPQTKPTQPGKLFFLADSDAHIVKGLIAVLMSVYSGKTTREIQAIDIKNIFEKLGLEEHLSPNRRNGFFAMVEKIKYYAQKYAKAA